MYPVSDLEGHDVSGLQTEQMLYQLNVSDWIRMKRAR